MRQSLEGPTKHLASVLCQQMLAYEYMVQNAHMHEYVALLNTVLTYSHSIVIYQLRTAVDSSKGVATSTGKTLLFIDAGSSILAGGASTAQILTCFKGKKIT